MNVLPPELAAPPEAPRSVLFFTADVARQSGASYALRETVRRMAATGRRAIVVVPDIAASRELFPEKEFDVVYLPIRRLRLSSDPRVQAAWIWSSARTVRRLTRIIRRERVELVHFNEIVDFIAGVAARAAGVPVVCHVRADGIAGVVRPLLARIISWTADAIIVPSRSTAAWMTEALPRLGRKIRVVHDHAFDIREYRSDCSPAAVRRELGLGPEKRLVLLISKLMIPKGHLLFIRAAERVCAARGDVAFAIVGGAVDGHEREAAEIAEAARALQATGALRLLGNRRDLEGLYAASDVVVHCPVYPDTFPTVVLLGMLMGKPVIGTAIGGIPEQIKDGVTGVLVAPGSPEALAAAVLDLLNDREKAGRLGRAAMEETRRGYAPEAQARALSEIYVDACRAVRPGAACA